MSTSFQEVLDQIRSISKSEVEKGHLFERLIKKYLTEDPLYKYRFSDVWLWSEWIALRSDFSGSDTGVDLVAKERSGGYCAIQCKCYAEGTKIQKSHLDSFISASAREPFTARIFIDTVDHWGAKAVKTIQHVKPECSVIHYSDLASQPFNWPDLAQEDPETLSYQIESFSPRSHQKEAIEKVIEGFASHDRGKMIMACGTGKTYTALRIAEQVAGVGGRVLYLVPSISLFQQSMREWAEQKGIPHSYIGICSDTRAGRNEEDASLQELEIPVTTNTDSITKAISESSKHALTVVFSTYQSLGLLEKAQDEGAPTFDLIFCDEAHRTTGIEHPDDNTSPFVLVHDAARIRGEKRLYMTATPRIYTEGAKSKAVQHSVEVYSMDDTKVYGPEFHRLQFSSAVEQDLLSDYKVVVLAMSEQHVDAALQSHLAAGGSEINLTDAAKILGCWRALHNPENTASNNGSLNGLRRAIVFTNKIISSKRLVKYWDSIVEHAIERLPASEQRDSFRCETQHVDGQHHALERKSRIEWLKGSSQGRCRILSNARCLSEGIDVPALDAVVFMSPKNSQVEIVQAVGRAMRKATGKEYGYIVLPVAIPQGIDPATALEDNERFAPVWGVLRALRSHDDRFDAEINQIDLNNQPTDRIIIGGDDDDKEKLQSLLEMPYKPLDIPPGAIYAKIVEKCGDRKYWETWAKDVAEIFSHVVTRIDGLLGNPKNAAIREWFEAFHEELKVSINESITRVGAIDMMAQHILTRPVFEALFEQYNFSEHNPVAQALDALKVDFGEFGLENETRDLERFYESVRLRARGLDNSEARQRVLMELYEKFFATAMKKDAEKLGIVYTPVEIVDFILASADHVLRDEFGRSLSDEDVHILDPFTGTGIFLVRLLQSALLDDGDIRRKYRNDLHANELVLLAYYIAAIHIEEAYHGRSGLDKEYEPFNGIVLTDTFNLHTDRSFFPKEWLPDNSERAERQLKQPIQIIIGNPPWSAKQKSVADDNPNVVYPSLEKRVSETYAAYSKSTNKNSLYDTYKMSIRWASDRIGEQGVIAFVTNGSWITADVDSGLRACFEEEFSSIYVVNLRGNARTQGALRQAEGGNVFGQGSRATVAVTVLVRNPSSSHQGCQIRYWDIGDYLTRDEKLTFLQEAGSIAGIKTWQDIKPDYANDWINQGDKVYKTLYPIGSKQTKSDKSGNAIFGIYSRGLETARDAYLYNFSRKACAYNAERMVSDYDGALKDSKELPSLELDEVIKNHVTCIRWDSDLKRSLVREKKVVYSPNKINTVHYRPFVKQHCFTEDAFIHRKGQMDSIFPSEEAENQVICVPGTSSAKPFSCLMVDHIPDLNLITPSQCFPRFRYVTSSETQVDLFEKPDLKRIDNITDNALTKFRAHYDDMSITKEDVFNYTYGVLHAIDFRERFAVDLSKELPRIPLASGFRAFTDAGNTLAKLHVNYEVCEEYPLTVEFSHTGEPSLEHYEISDRSMKFADKEKSVLIVNDYIRIKGIPPEAHNYQVNGRSPIEWLIDRFRITRDKESGIVNDPNEWFENPIDLVKALKKVVYLSVVTNSIVNGLPPALGHLD